MSSYTIHDIADEIDSLVRQTEEDLAEQEGNPYIDLLYEQDVDLDQVRTDLSDGINTQIGQLKAKGIRISRIVKLLRDSAKPDFVTLHAVRNEIASVIPGEIEVPITKAIKDGVKALDPQSFKELTRRIQGYYSSPSADFISVSCNYDRWALVVDEDLFIETALNYLANEFHGD